MISFKQKKKENKKKWCIKDICNKKDTNESGVDQCRQGSWNINSDQVHLQHKLYIQISLSENNVKQPLSYFVYRNIKSDL